MVSNSSAGLILSPLSLYSPAMAEIIRQVALSPKWDPVVEPTNDVFPHCGQTRSAEFTESDPSIKIPPPPIEYRPWMIGLQKYTVMLT